VPSNPLLQAQQSSPELHGQALVVPSLHMSELPAMKQPLLTHS